MSTRDPRVFSNPDLAKICCLLIFDCVIASGLAEVDELGLLRGLAFAVLVMQPVIFFNWGLLVALRIARARFATAWPLVASTAMAATAFAILSPPLMRLIIYKPGSAAAAECLVSPSPWADVQLATTAFFWLWAWKISVPSSEDVESAQRLSMRRKQTSPR